MRTSLVSLSRWSVSRLGAVAGRNTNRVRVVASSRAPVERGRESLLQKLPLGTLLHELGGLARLVHLLVCGVDRPSVAKPSTRTKSMASLAFHRSRDAVRASVATSLDADRSLSRITSRVIARTLRRGHRARLKEAVASAGDGRVARGAKVSRVRAMTGFASRDSCTTHDS